MNNRKTATIIKFFAIIVATLICIAATYFLASNIFGGQLANASNGITLTAWKDKYLNVVLLTGALTGVCALVWFLLSSFVFKVQYATGGGQRTIWAVLALLAAIISVVVPMLYPARVGIQINAPVIAMFVIFFVVINYWLVTIFATPLSFKYTPVGAQLFLSRGGK